MNSIKHPPLHMLSTSLLTLLTGCEGFGLSDSVSSLSHAIQGQSTPESPELGHSLSPGARAPISNLLLSIFSRASLVTFNQICGVSLFLIIIPISHNHPIKKQKPLVHVILYPIYLVIHQIFMLPPLYSSTPWLSDP